MLFWVLTAALGLGVTAILAASLIRARGTAAAPEAFDVQVYRDQLAEVDRDLARGVINDAEAERVRTEVSRRILAADAKAKAATDTAGQPQGISKGMAAVLALVLLGGGFGFYSQLGAPGYGDLGLQARKDMAAERRENRPSQEEAEAQMPARPPIEGLSEQYLQLMTQLRATVEQRPNDLQGNVLLARNEATLGNFRAAYEAQQRVVAIKGDGATAQDYADLADMMVLAAGGYVSPEAERALEAALKRDRNNGVARYYSGLMFAQIGRPDIGFRFWQKLVSDGPEDAAWMGPVRAQIEDLARLAGVDYKLPPVSAMPGPSAEDVQNAGDMSEEDRQEMIRGMVQRLSDRLASQGGSPAEWARLIGALGVLGDTNRARAIWEEAQLIFGDNAAAMEQLSTAARQAGVLE